MSKLTDKIRLQKVGDHIYQITEGDYKAIQQLEQLEADYEHALNCLSVQGKRETQLQQENEKYLSAWERLEQKYTDLLQRARDEYAKCLRRDRKFSSREPIAVLQKIFGEENLNPKEGE